MVIHAIFVVVVVGGGVVVLCLLMFLLLLLFFANRTKGYSRHRRQRNFLYTKACSLPGVLGTLFTLWTWQFLTAGTRKQ